MNEHLAEISACVPVGAIALVILEGAGWHTSPTLARPDNIVSLLLPPYAPELNPVENIRAFLRANFLSHRVFDDYDAVLKASADAWKALIELPGTITAIATRTWAQVITWGAGIRGFISLQNRCVCQIHNRLIYAGDRPARCRSPCMRTAPDRTSPVRARPTAGPSLSRTADQTRRG